jgi:hypothetical protein
MNQHKPGEMTMTDATEPRANQPRGPAPDPADIGAYSDYPIKGIFAASDAFIAEEERLREERRNRPEAKARRSNGSRKGWITRRAREAVEVEEERARFDHSRPTGPLCDGIYHDSRGVELSCMLPPDHDDEDCGDAELRTHRKES